MVDSIKMYTLSMVLLTMLAVSTFSLPASDSTTVFTRCEGCHPANADTTKSSQHYRMKCLDCHLVSGSQNVHNLTTPKCHDCHAGIIEGKQHKKFRYFPEPDFIYSPNITVNDRGIYISIVNPVNASID